MKERPILKEWYPEGYKANFKLVWDSINAKRAPWNSNPWVWAVTFKRLELKGQA